MAVGLATACEVPQVRPQAGRVALAWPLCQGHPAAGRERGQTVPCGLHQARGGVLRLGLVDREDPRQALPRAFNS